MLLRQLEAAQEAKESLHLFAINLHDPPLIDEKISDALCIWFHVAVKWRVKLLEPGFLHAEDHRVPKTLTLQQSDEVLGQGARHDQSCG